MTRSFPARYPGRCAADCDEPIRAGDDVRYLDGQLVHADCDEPHGCTVTARRPERAPCPACFLVHAGECL